MADQGLSSEGRANPKGRNLLFGQIFLKVAWKWRKLGRRKQFVYVDPPLRIIIRRSQPFKKGHYFLLHSILEIVSLGWEGWKVGAHFGSATETWWFEAFQKHNIIKLLCSNYDRKIYPSKNRNKCHSQVLQFDHSLSLDKEWCSTVNETVHITMLSAVTPTWRVFHIISVLPHIHVFTFLAIFLAFIGI